MCVYPTEQAKAGLGRRITMMIFLLESVMRIQVGESPSNSPTGECDVDSSRKIRGLFNDTGRCAKFLRIIKCLYGLYL